MTLRVALAIVALTSVACGRGDFTEIAQVLVGPTQPIDTVSALPNSLLVSWDPTQIDETLVNYSLWVGANEQAVQQRRSPAFAWDLNDDPDLAWRFSPYGNALVHRTLVRDLEPATTYHLDLWGWFENGTVAKLASGSATTAPAPTTRVVIFDDAPRTGSWIDCLAVEQDPSDASNQVLRVDSVAPLCHATYINSRLGALGIDVNGLSDADWARGYVELRLWSATPVGGPRPVYYLEAVMFDQTDDTFGMRYPRYLSLPARDGFQWLQIPFTELKGPGAVAPSSTNFVSPLRVVQVGADWGIDGVVRFDDISVAY